MKTTTKPVSFLALALIPLVAMALSGTPTHAQTSNPPDSFPPTNPFPSDSSPRTSQSLPPNIPPPYGGNATPLPSLSPSGVSSSYPAPPYNPTIVPAPMVPTPPVSSGASPIVTIAPAATASPVMGAITNSNGYMTTVNPVPLNEFAKAMAAKAGYTYVANPLVTGDVDGSFVKNDPITLLREAARANGYAVRVDASNHAIELENAQTRAALPQVLYTRRLKYLRAPYVRDPGTDQDLTSTTPNGSGSGGSSSGGAGSSGGESGSSSTTPSAIPGSQAERIEALFKPVLSDSAYLKYDMKTSTLIARDSDINIANLNALINQLDVDRPLIRVEVEALEVNEDAIRNRGINWASTLGDGAGLTLGLSTQDALYRVFGGFVGGLNARLFTDPTGDAAGTGAIFSVSDITVVVKLLNQINAVDSKARWFVDTEDNESGQTKVVVEQPIVQISDSTSTTTSQVQFNYVDIGNILRVTPQLLPNGLVRLQIHPELSNITGTVTSSASSAPIISSRSTEAIVTCPINKVCILGGLQDLFRTDANNKIPLLGDIPVLRWLFSSQRNENQTRNLVIMVRPTLIDPSSGRYTDAVNEYVKSYQWRPENDAANNKNIHSTTDPRWDSELQAPADVPVSRLSAPLPQTSRQPVERTPYEQ